MATTHIAVLPDGQEVQRVSENRKYTHCYAYQSHYTVGGERTDDGPWRVGGWGGSERLATAAGRALENQGYKVRVIPCEQKEGRRRAKKKGKKQ